MTRKLVAVECNADELMMRTLGIESDQIAHQHSIGEVCKYLLKSSTRIGVIDEDPMGSHPRIIKQFVQRVIRHDIKILYHSEKEKWLFVICPRLEEWICSRCKESDVSLADFDLPANPKDFKKVINSNLLNVEKLLHALLQKQNEALLFLKAALSRG